MGTSTLEDLLETYIRVSEVNQAALDQLGLVAERFHQRGIDFILLKGADLLTRFYGARGMRPMADVDLLVRESDLAAIDAELGALDYRLQIDGNPAYRSPDGTLVLDLITSIWYLDSPEALDDLWQRARSRTVSGQRMKGMGSEDLFIYLTAYTVLHRGTLSPSFAKDLSLLAMHERPAWDRILDEVERRNLRVPVHHGLSYARSRESLLDLPEDVIARLAPSGPGESLLAFLLRRLVTERVVDGLGHFLLFLTLPGLKRWNWLRRAFFPSPAFLRYRYGEPGVRHPLQTRLRRALYLVFQAHRLVFTILCLVLQRTASVSR